MLAVVPEERREQIASSGLRATVRRLLRDRPNWLTYQVIAEGTGIDYQYIRRLCNGNAVNPHADKIQLLYEYLTQTRLDVRQGRTS